MITVKKISNNFPLFGQNSKKENYKNISETYSSNDTALKITKAVAIGGAVLAGGLAIYQGKIASLSKNTPIRKFDLSYIKTLADDMSKVLGKVIKPEQLSSVMGKEELSTTLPKIKAENYTAFKETLSSDGVDRIFNKFSIEHGIFKIDLHSHTNHSDGVGKVSEILDNVVRYANKLRAKTGEKFIFSITDHDSVNGTREALHLISQNPKRYENLRFVPGVELSFVHKTDKNNFAISELLAHCINPYSKETFEFIESLKSKRAKMIDNMMADLVKFRPDIKFSKQELHRFFLDNPRELYKYNLHWRMYNYAQIKQRMSGLAKQWGKNPEEIYNEIMPQWHIFRENKSPETFEKFMAARDVDLTKTRKIDEEISLICHKYFPKTKDGEIITSSERTFDDIIEHFSKDKNALLGFAHPGFIALHFDNPETAFNNFIQCSKGLIKTTEKYHQGYFIPIEKGQISEKYIEKVNEILNKYKLLNIGGHDNHQKSLINFDVI